MRVQGYRLSLYPCTRSGQGTRNGAHLSKFFSPARMATSNQFSTGGMGHE